MWKLAVAVAAALVGAAGCSTTGAPSHQRLPTGVQAPIGAGRPAVRLHTSPCPTSSMRRPAGTDAPPAITLPCFGSPGSIALVGLRNTMVNVWASWCGPCREEMPMLQAAHRRWGASIRMLGINSRDNPSAAADFLVATGVTYAQALDPAGQVPGRLGSPGLPVTIAIDSSGAVVYQHAGQLALTDLTTIKQRLSR